MVMMVVMTTVVMRYDDGTPAAASAAAKQKLLVHVSSAPLSVRGHITAPGRDAAAVPSARAFLCNVVAEIAFYQLETTIIRPSVPSATYLFVGIESTLCMYTTHTCENPTFYVKRIAHYVEHGTT